MATLKGLFSQAITEGMASAKKIVEPAPRAMAYAALADAMVKTGLIQSQNLDDGTDVADPAPASTPATGKEALKPETSKKTPAAKKPAAAPEPTPEPEPEVEFTEEWTEEALAAKKEQIEFINSLKEAYELDALNDCVSQFSEGTYSSLDEITPLNIDAYIAFMQEMIAKA